MRLSCCVASGRRQGSFDCHPGICTAGNVLGNMHVSQIVGAVQAGTAIILYDGVCNLCSGAVRFIVKRDPGGYFRFAQLQSERSHRLLEQHGLAADERTTIVLIEGAAAFSQSEAVLRIARRLRPPWLALVCLRVFPRWVRDAVYALVSRHRYRWFGRKAVCELPPENLCSRFL